MSVDIGERIYEAYLGEMGPQLMHETQRQIHWMCSAVQAESVLDVGCGQGLVPILLGREGRSAVGIDSNSAAIASAEEHLTKESSGVRKRVSFVEADFGSHDFGDVRFDCIVMGKVLSHLLEPQRFIAKAASLLRPGARLIVTVPFGWNDQADDKHTFYFLEPYRLLAEHFDVERVSLQGKWLGLVGVRREGGAPTQPSSQDLQQVEQAFMAIERELLDAAASLRARLEDSTTKLRTSNEEIAKLKRELSQHEIERKAAEITRQSTENELQEQRRQAEQPRNAVASSEELAKEIRARHVAEVELARLDERTKQANKISELERRMKEAELAKLEGFRAQLAGQVQALEAQLAEQAPLIAQAKELRREVQTRDEQLGQLTRQLAGTQGVVRELEASAEASKARFDAQTQELESTRASLAEAKTAAATAAAATVAAEAAAKAAAATAAASAPTKELEDLRSQLRATRDLRDRAESKAQGLEKQLAELQKQLASSDKLVRAARQAAAGGAVQAEKRGAEQVRNTLSFQLGHELINGFKSRESIKALPRQLWQLQQEANRRRTNKAAKKAALSGPKLHAPLPPRAPSKSDGPTAPNRPGAPNADDDLIRG